MCRVLIVSIAITILLISCGERNSLQLDVKVSESQKQWSLVWSDEFEYEGLPDSTKWSYDVGDACDKPAGCGWGNQELQYYTDARLKNARVEGGHLIIETHQEKFKTRDYTSARLVTKGKGDWLYGKVVTRAKLPSGKGVWSAIWMLSTDDLHMGWPNSGEIDIMENVGFDQDSVLGTIHTLKYNHLKGTHKNGGVKEKGFQEEFHDYTLEWEEDEMRWYIDDKEIFRYANEGSGFEAWPFDHRFYLIMNIAYGGEWGGRKGVSPELLPSKMEVDYVRVYQR